jgi:hypothetical protein
VISAIRRVRPWLLWWAALAFLWLLVAGDWNRTEIVAAACAAAVAATLAEVARTAEPVRAALPLPPRSLVAVLQVPWQVLVDLGIVLRALGRALLRREVEGRFFVRRFDAGGDDPPGASLRAWTVLVAGYSPNAYVVDIDRERNVVLVHDLVPNRASEAPAG